MAPGHGGDPQDESAKHAFDRIGGIIQKEAYNKALDYQNALHGFLSEEIFESGKIHVTDPCELDYKYDTNVTSTEIDPCANRSPDRFSDTKGAECNSKRIRGSNGNIGACAPFRRLHVCDRNLELIEPKNINTTHNLLVDVCLAAQFEGHSISGEHAKYQQKYSDSQICTALARSFADIGDIIRGKDLYLGNKKEKEKLQENLKSIFLNIQNDKSELKGLSLDEIREYWWALNRKEVWKAITCKDVSAKYFRESCSAGRSSTHKKCRCADGDVPTNFDYVPQYLRWFEEWSEEFCIKRKKKLENAKKNCREGTDGEKYCSRNGYDCKETVRKINKYRWDNACAGCFFSCSHFVKWIENQKEEFEKQKDKYNKEINEKDERKLTKQGTINNLYSKQFYDQLKKGYGSMNSFLNLLNKEKRCSNHPRVNGKSSVNFTEDPDDIFSHTEYCQACPWCGMKCTNGRCVNRPDDDTDCPQLPEYEPPEGVEPTKIDVLYTGEGNEDILVKLKEFCKTHGKTGFKNEEWKCYYHSGIDKCVLEADDKHGIEKKIKDYYDFFTFWVTRMLKDSMDWRKNINKCLNKSKDITCMKGCKKNCDCFKKWVDKKESEWNQIKAHFYEQKNFNKFNPFDVLEIVLESEFLDQIKNAYGNPEEIERIKRIIEKNRQTASGNSSKSEELIQKLVDHEKEDVQNCTKLNPEDDCPNSASHESDSEEEDEEEIPGDNPCGGSSGSKPKKTVKSVAKDMHHEEKKQMLAKSRIGGISKLKGNIFKAEFKNGRKGSQLKDKDICNIDKKFSNSTRTFSKGPCCDKDKGGEMFKLQNRCKSGADVNKKHAKDVFLPPRRQHFCTSNLEYIETNNKPLDGTSGGDAKVVNHSFLGDVLLSANFEAYFIKNKYRKQPGYGDDSTICRAIKYNFADLGDIIKGTDLWDEDGGEKTTQGYLVTIFGKIKNELPKEIQKRYRNRDDKHLDLRKDWWEANRHQVWKAMKCALKNISCDDHRGTTPPLDDYIPQRLRWMTEWVEWYCKMQSQKYKTLQGQCAKCRTEGTEKCRKGNKDCETYTAACENYKKFVDTWKEQWTNISNKYKTLYEEARVEINNVKPSAYGDPNDQQVIAFFKELQKANGDTTLGDTTTPYSSAAGYIHQELSPHMQCKGQTRFCGETHPEYAFRDPPKGYEEACKCDTRDKTKVPEKKKDVCEIVKPLLDGKGPTDDIDGCNQKYKNGKDTYPGWDCTPSTFKSGEENTCMPPRRKKLCIYNLEHYISVTSTDEELKEAFILCAAKETFLLWQKYKDDKQNKEQTPSELDNNLKEEKIPDDFKRQMFYTFGDYRDLCLDTDISSKLNTRNGVGKVKTNIDAVFQKIKQTTVEQRKNWWDGIKENVWKGMLCALEKAWGKTGTLTKNHQYSYSTIKFSGDNSPTLEEFITRPQFLRWMTEWGEEFCKKRKVQFDILVRKCNSCAVDDDGTKCMGECDECKTQCIEYQGWLKTWKGHYDKQKERYTEVKEQQPYNKDNDVKQSTHAYQYLGKQLTNIPCTSVTISGKCEYKCMDQSSSTDGMPESLEYPPIGYKETCICQQEELPHEVPEVQPPQKKDTCDIAEEILRNEGKNNYENLCREKFKNGKRSYPGWNCNSNIFKPGQQDGACMPPRRQKLYLKNLQDLKDKSSPEELRKAFIETAAVETFFAWHKFKKDKEKKKPENIAGLPLPQEDDEEENPQKVLDEGNILDEFKRQMFYTFGDYRDLCVGNDLGKPDDTKNISQKVASILNIGSKGTTPQNWWDENGEDIWNGMLCALSYKTDTQKKDEELYKKLIGDNAKNTKYNYKTVTFEGGLDGTIKLKEFSRRPTFFRWLEEWGEEFCKKRKDKLSQIKEECRGKYDNKYCSGDGYDCKLPDLKHYNIYANLDCPGCHDECRKYKEWIGKKEKEFNKQKRKYEKDVQKSSTSSKNYHDDEFHNYLKKHYTSVDKFLESLNDCKTGKVNKDKKNEINFKNPDEIFGPSEYCKTCPLNGVTCNNRGVCTPKTENEENTTEGKSNDINILLNNGATDDTENELQKDCKTYGLYKDLKNQKWKCQHMNTIYKCELQNHVNTLYSKNKIPLKVLFERWLRDFLEGYNKSKEKITRCTENVNSCIEGCKGKCVCVGKWLKIKEQEWKIIKEYYKKHPQYTYSVPHWVKSFFEQGPFIDDVNEAKKVVQDEDEQKKLWGCTARDGCEAKEETEKHGDFITNLTEKLTEKIEFCKKQHKTSDKPHQNCISSPLYTFSTSHYDDVDESPDYTPTTSVVPEICKDFVAPEPPAPTMPEEDTTDGDAGIDENVPVPAPAGDQKEEKVPADEAPKLPKKTEKKTPTKPLPMDYRLTDVLLPSAFPLSVGIAFAALSYFVLKKKTKSSVGNLFQILQIPKGDYDIPTLKSSNRYIPYVSDRYKGKTYIYMEGDSSGDEKYAFMSDTTDVTSSESEYEELDINDIYVPGSPKYKTLIEVVLEPSKRDIHSDYIPSSDTPMNKFTDEEWNQLKHDFISNMLQNQPNDIPNNNISANIPLNTHLNTLYFDNPEEKPFITKIHDRNLYSGEEYSYNINFDPINISDSTNSIDHIPISGKNDSYSGIDLISDSLSGNQHNIYGEVLKRKENELFGTNHTKKNTSTNRVAKNTNSDPILNQINLFHKWLDRHRHMCDQWDKNKKEELLDKLKEEWNKENNNNSGKTYNRDNKPSHNHVLNTDASIQIDMDNPKSKNEFTNMDTILDDLEKYNEPYYYDFYEDDIYYDVNDDQTSVDHINMDHNKMDNNNSDVPTKVQIEMNVINNQELLQNEYPISDM